MAHARALTTRLKGKIQSVAREKKTVKGCRPCDMTDYRETAELPTAVSSFRRSDRCEALDGGTTYGTRLAGREYSGGAFDAHVGMSAGYEPL